MVPFPPETDGVTVKVSIAKLALIVWSAETLLKVCEAT
jgi:hypothetical protein